MVSKVEGESKKIKAPWQEEKMKVYTKTANVINEDGKALYMRVPVLYNAPVTCRKWNYYQKADGTVVGRSYNQAFSNGIWYHPDGFESPGYRLKNPESHLGY